MKKYVKKLTQSQTINLMAIFNFMQMPHSGN